MHSVTSNAVAGALGITTYLIPIRLDIAVANSTSWQRILWLGSGFLDKYDACPNISGKTKKVRLVMSLMTARDNGISVMLKRNDNVERVVIDNLVVWGGVSAYAYSVLVYIPIDPSFIDEYAQYHIKSNVEDVDVGVGYIFAEVYYE